MVEAMLYRLNNDEALKALLGATEADTHVYPLEVDVAALTASDGSPLAAIAYTDTDLKADDPRISRFEVRVSSPDFDRCRAVMQRVTELLNVPDGGHGWWYDGVNVKSSVLNGGGNLSLDGADVYQRYGNFDVKWR